MLIKTCFDTSPIPFALIEEKVIDTFTVFIFKYCNVAYSRIFNRNPSELIKKQLTPTFSFDYPKMVEKCNQAGGKIKQIIKNNYDSKDYSTVVYKIEPHVLATTLHKK